MAVGQAAGPSSAPQGVRRPQGACLAAALAIDFIYRTARTPMQALCPALGVFTRVYLSRLVLLAPPTAPCCTLGPHMALPLPVLQH